MDHSEFAALPAEWRKNLGRRRLARVTTGMGGASLWRLAGSGAGDEQYLKLASGEAAHDLRAEAERTIWLGSRKIRVPRILGEFYRDGFAAVRMSALPGIPADQADAAKSVPLLAGAIDARNFAARNVGVTPAQLYARLDKEIPLEDDFVVVHGDPWLSNILIDPSGDVGFVDCGRSGRSDRYTDLAILFESLTELFGEAAANAFLRAYGIEGLDRGRLWFFRDLYELF